MAHDKIMGHAKADKNKSKFNEKDWQHPCLKCGACCSYFRVAFYWRESEPEGEYKVPKDLTVDLDSFHRAMRGTEVKHQPRCIALRGNIGEKAWCGIYENRPTPCRQFKASYEDGYSHPRCDQARAKHGLSALNKSDWPRRPRKKEDAEV